MPTPAPVTDALIRSIAAKYGYAPAALKAILSVETGGAGYDAKTGKILIQFEPSWFKRLLPKAQLATVAQTHPAEWATVLANGVEGQTGERIAFNAAWAINPHTTLLSTSFGEGQIMGFQFERLGYASVEVMVDAFREGGEAVQFEGVAKFLATDAKLSQAVKNLDWAGVAYRYNGSNFKVNNYDVKLQAAHAKWAPLFA